MSSQWKLVPVEPTETMVINGFESVPDECFTDEEVWEQYQEMSGCQQAAFRAKLCWAAMLAAAPVQPQADLDRVTAERDGLRVALGQSGDLKNELQQRLTAADERSDVLVGLLAKYYNRSDVCAFMAKDIDAALKPAECCTVSAQDRALLEAGDYTPEELFGIGGKPSCPKCAP